MSQHLGFYVRQPAVHSENGFATETTTVWTIRMRIKTAPNRPVPPTSSSARRVAASPILSAVTLITTVATLLTKRAAYTSLAMPPNSLATTAVASRPPGNAIPRTIAATVAMKEVNKNSVMTFLIQFDFVIVFIDNHDRFLRREDVRLFSVHLPAFRPLHPAVVGLRRR